MRDLPWSGEFDAAFCFGNSFGYLDDAGNAAFLSAVARTLEPGGRFAIDYGQTAESILPRPGLEARQDSEIGGFRFVEDTRYDPSTAASRTASRSPAEGGPRRSSRRRGSTRSPRSSGFSGEAPASTSSRPSAHRARRRLLPRIRAPARSSAREARLRERPQADHGPASFEDDQAEVAGLDREVRQDGRSDEVQDEVEPCPPAGAGPPAARRRPRGSSRPRRGKSLPIWPPFPDVIVTSFWGSSASVTAGPDSRRATRRYGRPLPGPAALQPVGQECRAMTLDDGLAQRRWRTRSAAPGSRSGTGTSARGSRSSFPRPAPRRPPADVSPGPARQGRGGSPPTPCRRCPASRRRPARGSRARARRRGPSRTYRCSIRLRLR